MLKSWVLSLFLALLFFFPCISLASSSNEFTDIEVADQERGSVASAKSKDLKEASHRGEINVEDYGTVDPSPTTKASIRPGPIQHGSPINPYIPKPPTPPPANPEDGG
ncbi:PREDICTED: uncharacterized protein LOC104801605 [Tarenaya hassleriana]|uniref:uncharacterized protein LOC104801605 n=1 Tax=Tarenaya hassleriana TaxID=28532 RepID=UPI00053C69D1|nr:PREDICTED: uncharacterized protein LOC104801605 [Tarenaya hassleriana]XP_010523222.1 PREDICTED: uncharacterized protein LOC104801605 [Tarenaya hassleriana]XP_010523223.1 PREDICTED: uncharacterized protein LOC104801605 [Tarenaya hassleriana]XP_010523224.1 PREDICTED: uncharacterized protein LOC104801605 [Tarenaya hassleriana]XP_010523225.1 PREDICTED: uncharacterized protein LOC104801605 [Tarenaya hassleriana]